MASSLLADNVCQSMGLYQLYLQYQSLKLEESYDLVLRSTPEDSSELQLALWSTSVCATSSSSMF